MKREPNDLFVLVKLVEQIKTNLMEGETLSYKQIEILVALLKWNNLSITEIAYRMDVMPASISALTEKLLRKGLVQRSYNLLDRRVVTINLTEEGELIARNLQSKQDKIVNTMEDCLTKEEVHTLNYLLEKINDH